MLLVSPYARLNFLRELSLFKGDECSEVRLNGTEGVINCHLSLVNSIKVGGHPDLISAAKLQQRFLSLTVTDNY